MNSSLGITFDIAIETAGWPDADKVLALLEKLAETGRLINTAPLPDAAEVSVLLTSDEYMRTLNRDWRDRDKPTNVLSFAANDGLDPENWSPVLGDIVLALETVTKEAQDYGKSFDDHLTHLLVHGFLHLVGHDHRDDGEALVMETLERKILARVGIADPYEDA